MMEENCLAFGYFCAYWNVAVPTIELHSIKYISSHITGKKNVSKFIVNLYLNLTPSLCVQFHKDCIDSWLLHSHPTCPVDGQVVWDPVTAQLEGEEEAERTSQR